MILQNCIFPDKSECTELYYRASRDVLQEEHGIFLPAGKEFTTDTYMNCFDAGAWKKYTDISEIFLYMSMEGRGKISLICEEKGGTKKVLELSVDTFQGEIKLPEDFAKGLVYFRVHAESDMRVHRAYYGTAQKKKQECHIALIICTYKRKEELEQTLNVLRQGNGFSKEDRWLDVVVIDNASELSDEYGECIRVIHNRNTGGSGGFSRGMDEVVENLNSFPATHVVLMDDDAEVRFESFIRLRALLSYEKEEYRSEPVAGRMFRTDKPVVQYTAAEIWNGGDLRHLGWNHDMSERENLWQMNDNAGAEYGGWWFECYPMEFVRNNRPLPFFIHCDDVEYGLRHGGTPIILNGIQVWHETAEYRQTPVMEYYDTRNALIVNTKYGLLPSGDVVIMRWKEKVSRRCLEKDYLSEFMVIKGMMDYLKGQKWFYGQDSLKLHKRLSNYEKRGVLKYVNAFLWRIATVLCLLKLRHVWKSISLG